ncbi:hypothetical protein [Glycomyces xiaoerkulensis]|uniref:hypothetical protein n=1 Tax=Glycomyces xiaoerkulensis TaxID=2038139 RepID=UPI000C258123|nr:hypothetical protein [Glycomyces xiaoerkulensis]
MTLALTVLLILYFLQSLAKFAVWLALPYRIRIKRVGSYYARGQRIIRGYDTVSLVLVVAMTVLAFASGVEVTSFAAGLIIGMTLIQVFIHRFDRPLADEQMPPEPVRPNQHTSYAIQANPWLAWREIALISLLSIWAIYALTADNIVG